MKEILPVVDDVVVRQHQPVASKVEIHDLLVAEVIDRLLKRQQCEVVVDYYHLARAELVVQQQHPRDVTMRHDLESLYH